MNQHKWVDSLWFTFFDFVEKLLRWRISANDECGFYEFSFHTIRELHTNHELWIANAVHRLASALRSTYLDKMRIARWYFTAVARLVQPCFVKACQDAISRVNHNDTVCNAITTRLCRLRVTTHRKEWCTTATNGNVIDSAYVGFIRPLSSTTSQSGSIENTCIERVTNLFSVTVRVHASNRTVYRSTWRIVDWKEIIITSLILIYIWKKNAETTVSVEKKK